MLNNKWIVTNEEYWCSLWDKFLGNNKKGHYLQLSDWLKSYQAYGFDWFLILNISSDDKINGGVGCIFINILGFKILICPAGPIIKDDENEIVLIQYIDRFKKEGVERNCIFAQINLLSSDSLSIHTNLPLKDKLDGFIFGTVINEISIIDKLRLVDLSPFYLLKKEEFEEEIFKTYPTKKRTNIRRSLRNNLELRYATTENEIHEAYKCFENTALEEGYTIRSWKDIRPSIINEINQGFAFMLTAHLENNIKGAVLLINTGQRLTYMMGGTKKEKPDIMVGTFLHWHAILLTKELNYCSYDMSPGGSKGVIEFKKSFNAYNINISTPGYWILNRFKFKIFVLIYKYIRPYKNLISRILSKIKK
jgi:lipid II:glycine glycyltransferase (peptidoglycan interpeptide bridge formation enzyme)